MRTLIGPKIAVIACALVCGVSFGLQRYYSRRYLSVLPIMDSPAAPELTPAQEADARCGDEATVWLFMSYLCGIGTFISTAIFFWKWLYAPAQSARGFDVIQ
jgi:hypothetical protein